MAKLIKVATRLYFHCDIPYEAEIAENVLFCHNAFGVVVNPNAKIGVGAVVLESILDHTTAVGVPAKIVAKGR